MKSAFALVLSQAVQSLLIWVLLFLAHIPACRGLGAVPAYPYGSGTHLILLGASKRSLTKSMLVTHGQQLVSPMSCPITSWDHPGVDTTVPLSLGRPRQGVTEQWCPTQCRNDAWSNLGNEQPQPVLLLPDSAETEA